MTRCEPRTFSAASSASRGDVEGEQEVLGREYSSSSLRISSSALSSRLAKSVETRLLGRRALDGRLRESAASARARTSATDPAGALDERAGSSWSSSASSTCSG